MGKNTKTSTKTWYMQERSGGNTGKHENTHATGSPIPCLHPRGHLYAATNTEGFQVSGARAKKNEQITRAQEERP